MSRRAFGLAIGLAAGLLLLVAAFSLKWRMAHDSAIMLYAAFLIDSFGRVPYRDIFEMNTPGVHLANLFIGRAFGYSTSPSAPLTSWCSPASSPRRGR